MAIKTDSRMSNTWRYKAKYKTKYDPNSVDFKYITNTKKLQKEKLITPASHTVVGVTNSMDQKLHYNLNLNEGIGTYANNITKYFDRLYSVHPDHELANLVQYVFFVRPDLNLLNSKGELTTYDTGRLGYSYMSNNSTTNTKAGPNATPASDPYMQMMYAMYPGLIQQLSGTFIGAHDFMPFLVGRTKSLNLPDFSVKDYKMEQPFTGYNLPYASHALASKTGGTFDVVFRDDDELRVLKLFQMWDYYIDAVTRNKFAPRDDYVIYNRMDYACSVFVITCKPDATEIVHWTKYTGAFPINVPNSNLSVNIGQYQTSNEVSITFDYFMQGDPFDPLILVEFNKNAHVSDSSNQPYIPVYTSTKAYKGDTIEDLGMEDKRSAEKRAMTRRDMPFNKTAPAVLTAGNALVGSPFVCKNGKKYELRWKPTDKSLSPG